MSRPVTVVVPAHGRTDLLVQLLVTLDRQAAGGEPLPVIVSDDASARPVEQAVSGVELPWLALAEVRSETNGGPGAARNRGLARVQTSWVAFVDSDEQPGPGWLDRLEAIALDPTSPDGVEGLVDSGGDPGTPFTHVGSLAGGSHLSGNLAFRTEVLRAAGGFDERFFHPGLRLHFREDTELFFRLRGSSRRIDHDPELVVQHPPLPASYRAPLRDARRYYFDPLLAREHPERFREFNERRRMGPLSLRRARHLAAVGHVLGVGAGLVALATGRRRAAVAGGAVALGTWGANAAALTWGRRLPARDVAPVAVVALGLPWVYVVFYYRGVARFRHLPRL